MDRRAFFALAGSALVVAPRAARATGGLDVAGSAVQHQMRVLLASGSFAPPRPVDDWHFAWNGRTYRGTSTVVALPDGRSGLVNVLPLDAYLSGVLSSEMPSSWAPGAQQAQAIVARTYALGKLRPAKTYDVVASVSDQRYDGIEGETVEGRAAVDATSGVIVTYEDAPARVAYSACCGGRTADANDIWETPYPYLRGVVDPHCATSPGFAWQIDVARGAMDGAFGSSLAAIGALRTIQLDNVDPTDRTRTIRFVGDVSSFDATPMKLRTSLGAGLVRSTFVREVAVKNGGATISIGGTGRGHGVGFCQWGSRALGERGASAQEIVAFYFPGTSFGRA
ncbi:MAG: SpoIID/LytB domain-containing protein [Vulcanimicrobiaceae bacterium]